MKEKIEGILPVDKPEGISSFFFVPRLRKILDLSKIGHSGTLDPFASGILLFLLGKNFTCLFQKFVSMEKEYIAQIYFGASTDSHDRTGRITQLSGKIPRKEEVQYVLNKYFSGTVKQIPPMYSAKKVLGKKLHHWMKRGVEVDRSAREVSLQSTLLSYHYPWLRVKITCSKGTYIRKIAYDLGIFLGCKAYLESLCRIRNGSFALEQCLKGEIFLRKEVEITPCWIKRFIFLKAS